MSDNSIKAMCGYTAGPHIGGTQMLDRLPVGTVILDSRGEAWQKVNDCERFDEDGERLTVGWASAFWENEWTSLELFLGRADAGVGVAPLGLLYAPADANMSPADTDYTPDLMTLRSEYIYSRRMAPYSGEWRDTQDAQHGAEFDRFVAAYTAEVERQERMRCALRLREKFGVTNRAASFVSRLALGDES